MSSLAAGRVPPGGEPALYAGTPVQGVFGRPEGRADWVSLRGGNSEAVLVDPENPDVLYTAGLGCTAVVFDPTAPGVAYAAFFASGRQPATFVFQSLDGGVTWEPIEAPGIGSSFVLNLTVDDTGTLYAATRGGGIYKLELP